MNNMVSRALFSSDRQVWQTPDELFRQLDAEFGFELDVCATADNAKCRHFFSPEQNGLKQTWRGVCWMNAPYGSALPAWMAKAYVPSLEGATVVCLVPARTDTPWWHDFAMLGELPRCLTHRGFFPLNFCLYRRHRASALQQVA